MRFNFSLIGIQDRHIRYGHYVASMVTLAIYQLIALEANNQTIYLLPIAYFLLMFLVGKLFWGRYNSPEKRINCLSLRQRLYFLRELSLYAVIATASMLISTLLYEVRVIDALCSTLIIITFGYFAGVDTTLAASREWFKNGVEQSVDSFRLIPISVTMKRATLSILTLILLFGLTATLKLNETLEAFPLDHKPVVAMFATDLLFYLIMMGLLMVWSIRGYSRTLHSIIEPQLKVVRDAQAGEFEQMIPVVSQNELGLLAIQLNRLVDYVQDREKVEQMLRKVVSPDIMEKLLTTDTETLKHGEQRDVAILFCDIRGFTEMTEAASAEDVIHFLNTFFSELSEMVSRYNGIINKFMGDAILAVYSTEHPAWAIDNAMATALDIAKRVSELELPDGSPAKAGIGIHFGRVMAGTIGSDHRYEYTFLGDAVNTASRLEGLSKRLQHTIIVSSDAYQMLSAPLKGELTDLGKHNVRGKSDPIHVYGGPV
ncbi:MAG: adenylate/guanylate cyclase domain-containing protein [Chromatiales bacterium]|nr:adenylate/guanylate cyclase domain-containing protein [Chromatiales bacterium]